jgi:uncharacterized Zn-binding protein involved in type VI secretion
MGAVQRKGDANTHGGEILGGVDSVLVNGIPIAVSGLQVATHPPLPPGPENVRHQIAVTVSSQTSVFAGGKPVITSDDTDSCGDGRMGGSSDVFVGS